MNCEKNVKSGLLGPLGEAVPLKRNRLNRPGLQRAFVDSHATDVLPTGDASTEQR
jgi:hypothetical protein